MKRFSILFLMVFSFAFSVQVFGSESITYISSPCFSGDYRDEWSFEENGRIRTNDGDFTYAEYYSKNNWVPYDAYAVLIIDGCYIPYEFPIVDNDTSLIPVSVIAERLNCAAVLDEKLKKITIKKNDTVIELFIDNPAAIINGEDIILSACPRTIDGKTYVPLRFVAEALDTKVGFLKGENWTFPNIISITQNATTEVIQFSREQSIEMVKKSFADAEWGEYLLNYYGSIYEKLIFGCEEEAFSNFWVINVRLNDDVRDFNRISVWVDMYTGSMFGKNSGYEGVFEVSEGIERVVRAIKFQL